MTIGANGDPAARTTYRQAPADGPRRSAVAPLVDDLAKQIRAAILAGEIPLGSWLRQELLAEQFGVSRTPVREALHRLEHSGLVEPRGRGGWVVSAFTEQDIHELFELRRSLEPLGLDQLHRDPDPDVLAELGSFFDGFTHPVPSDRYEEYFARDNAFHKRIVACSGNGRLQRFYAVIESHIDRGRHFLSTGSRGRVEANLDEHQAITRALAAGDVRQARVELIHHLQQGEQLMVEHLRNHPGPR